MGTWRTKSRSRIVFNPTLGLRERSRQSLRGSVALAFVIVEQQSVDLTQGPRRVFDQWREVASARLACIRATVSRMRWWTTSAGTVGTPAASSPRLSSRASAHPGGASGRYGVSSMTDQYAFHRQHSSPKRTGRIRPRRSQLASNVSRVIPSVWLWLRSIVSTMSCKRGVRACSTISLNRLSLPRS